MRSLLFRQSSVCTREEWESLNSYPLMTGPPLFLSETCYCESANWPPVEPDSNSVPLRRAVASCIPVQKEFARNFGSLFQRDSRLFFLYRKLVLADVLRLPLADRPTAARSVSSDCSAPVSVVVLPCKVPPHLDSDSVA